jgi:CHC2 zinc finger
MSSALRYDRHEVAEAKSGASLQRIVGETVRLIRDGRRWVGLCPVHSERTPSLTIFDDGHWHCFGCGAHGDAVTWLMRVRGLSFPDALAYLGATPIEGRPQQPAYIATPTASPTRDAAIRCWTEAIPARGTLVETYLASRGLSLPDDPPIRFHPECQRGPRDTTGTVTFAPAMICLLVDPVTAKPTGVHRTYLTATGSKAPAIRHNGRVMPSKSIFGNWGCIRLAPPNETRRTLGIAEGLENALSAHALGWDWGPIWAASAAVFHTAGRCRITFETPRITKSESQRPRRNPPQRACIFKSKRFSSFRFSIPTSVVCIGPCLFQKNKNISGSKQCIILTIKCRLMVNGGIYLVIGRGYSCGMKKPRRVYEIVLLGRGAERRAAERAEAKAAAVAAAAAGAAKRVKGGEAHTPAWRVREERKRRKAREALAASFAAGTPAGLRLARRERDGCVVGSASPDVGVLPDQGVAAAAVTPASAALESDGAVPAGFMPLGSELIRIGRDDLADLGRRRVVGSPFGRDGC